MAKKLRIGIIFGGRSTEHEISIRSTQSVLGALDKTKFTPVVIGIDKNGTWLDKDESAQLLNGEKISKKKIDLVPKIDLKKIDVIFPMLHGSYGEDGVMQGFLKLIDIPFVGPGVLGSALGMDKDLTKRVLAQSGINVADGVVFKAYQKDTIKFASIKKQLGLPLFVKPANAGSSVGVSKVRTEKEFTAAIETAFKFDSKLLVEAAVVGREIECAVMGNEHPVAALPGEIIPGEEFYSYDDKYASTSTSVAQIPAQIPKKVAEEIKKIAIQAYQVLSLEGMTRVDFFYTDEGKLLINEVNTLPGFTSISMYPKMWEVSGVAFTDLVTQLIMFGIARYEREKSLTVNL